MLKFLALKLQLFLTKKRFTTVETKLDFSDVLIKPRYSTLSSRKDVAVETRFVTKWAKKEIVGIPVFVSNMDTTGTFTMARACAKYKMFTVIHKHYSFDDWRDFVENTEDIEEVKKYVFISTGTRDQDIEKLVKIVAITGITNICVDNANGYTKDFVYHISTIRRFYPDSVIIAGSVATKFMGLKLLEAGADIIRYGIGSGALCTTRMLTGIGVPQFSLIMDCAKFIQADGGLFMSDGGATCPGDVVKAFGAGADFVMSGSLFYGHSECEVPISINEKTGEKECIHYGMSSKKAMEKHYGKMAEYRAEEGKVERIRYRGDVSETIDKLLGGIRSACTYTNCRNISQLCKNVRFIKVNKQTNEIYSKNKF